MLQRDKVIKLINSVVNKVEQAEGYSRDQIYQELLGLQQIIEEARSELRSANAGDINQKHIPTATDELDEIVKATEIATMGIFNACEAMEKAIAPVSSSAADEIRNQIVKIYEACSFQDITGQRISKVVKSLRDIESKVGKILSVLHDRMGDMNLTHTSKDERAGDAVLMNGPQLPAAAISQDDIDKLLADFDTK